MQDIFQYSTPEKMGVSSQAILAWIDAMKESELAFHSLIVIRHQHIIAEGYYHPYQKDTPHILYSLSKSFVSIAIGFALQENKLSLDDPIVSYFGIDENKLEDKMKRVTIRHLLMMASGHREEPDIFHQEDMVQAFLTSHLEDEPGQQFLYNTPATYILSCILTQATGLSVVDYLKPRLFEPLDIQNFTWLEDSQQRNLGGYGLSLSTRDLAKFGLFLLYKGQIHGKQYLDPQYIQEATSAQISTLQKDRKDWKYGYGYQFWRCSRENTYRGDGAFGQYCLVLPDLDSVIILQSGLQDLQKPLDLVYHHLLPGFQDTPLPETSYTSLLKERLEHLEITHDTFYATSLIASFQHGLTYTMEDNDLGIHAISFDFKHGHHILFHTKTLNLDIHVGTSDYTSGELPVDDQSSIEFALPFYHHYSAIGGFISGRFCFQVVYTRTPYIDQYVIGFDEESITLYYKRVTDEKENIWKGHLKRVQSLIYTTVLFSFQ